MTLSLKPLKRVEAIKTILQCRSCSGGVTQLKPLKRCYPIEAIEVAYRDGFGLMRWVQWGYVK
jgi:hypothetical protein